MNLKEISPLKLMQEVNEETDWHRVAYMLVASSMIVLSVVLMEINLLLTPVSLFILVYTLWATEKILHGKVE